MNKKILLGLGALVALVAGVATISAYEAHVINVTAHIENALSVDAKELLFGTVFPQEYLTRDFNITLSQSFMAEPTADDVNYVIAQKPKPGYPNSLCPFLSKTDADPDDENDTSYPSYFVPASTDASGAPIPAHCINPGPDAFGKLAKSQNDTTDVWTVDLKVPPVLGTVGQDWPAGCPTVPEDSQDYGCDLWIEVTGISRIPAPGNNTVLSLENKYGEGWFVTTDNTYGTLEFNPAAATFDFTLTATGLTPGISYSLIYYADGWPGNHPGALIWSGLTNGSGDISYSGSINLSMDLPTAPDTNALGAKIWLIPSSAYSVGTNSVTTWPYDQSWLFEYNLIQYNDTDIP